MELYQKGRKNVSVLIPMLLYLLVGGLSAVVLYKSVESGPTVEMTKAAAVSLPLMIVSGIIGILLGIVIIVQVAYYAMVLFCKVTEDVDFEKKQVKKLVYLAEIVPSIPITLLQVIFMLATKAEVPPVLGTVSGIVSALLTCLMLNVTMRVSMGTKKAHITFPVLAFIVMVIIQVVSLVAANGAMANLAV